MNKEINGEKAEKKKGLFALLSPSGEPFAIIISIIAAVIFWGYVMSMESPTSERTFSGVEVSVSNMETLNEVNNLSIVSESGHLVVDVTLQGKKTVLNRLASDDIKAYIDVGNITDSGTYSLDIKYLPFPEGTTFVSASSNSMSMKVDVKETVQLPIVVKYENCIIPDGYSVGDYVLSTEVITVEGAKADLARIKEAIITISTGTLTKSLTVVDKVPVICDVNGKEVVSEYISYDKIYVDVKVPVYLEKDIELKYELVHGLFNETNADVTMSPAKIKIRGEASVVEGIKSSYTVCKINEKNTPDKFSTNISSAVFGNGIEIVDNVNRVDVAITHKNTMTTLLQIDTPYIKVNNPHNLSYTLPDDGLLVSFRCASDKIASLDIDNVTAHVDLSSVGADSNHTDVQVTFNFSDILSGSAYELGNYTVRVGFSVN